MPTEYEATLVICSKHPLVVVKELAQIEAIGGLRLDTGKSQAIHDVYFDTPAGELSGGHIALRIRRIDREWRIALKGPSFSSGCSVAARSELDLAWSQRALESIGEELATHDLPVDWAEYSADDPLATLAGSGFETVQDRAVDRIVRHVIPEGTRVRACDMLIDSVTYRFAGSQIGHHEVEVEAQDIDNIGTAERLVTHLMDRFGGTLRLWNYGKLATGRAVEELLKLDFLEHSIDDRGRLLPPAYDLILAYLRHLP